MTSEIMVKIREAETKAAEITANARSEAAQAVAAAQAAAEENMKTAVNEIIREIFEKWQ